MTNEIVLYQPDATIQLEVRLQDETVWLNQQQIALLFGTQRQAITKHLKNIFESGELDRQATCSILELVQKEGNRMVRRHVEIYNLDVIISVGYRVNTKRGIQFRQWANKVIKDYMLKGYAVNQRLLNIENQLVSQQKQLDDHKEKIDFFIRTNQTPVEQVFFGGEFFAARVLLEQLIKTAQQRVIIIDAYVDAATFEILDVRAKGVKATIYSGKDLRGLRDAHNATAGVEPIDTFIWSNPSHDRWLIIDDQLYHCGHSLKDMGKKLSAISLMGIPAQTIIDQVK